jgi:hypothetical protein
MHYVPEILVKGRVHAAQVGRSIGYSADHPENEMLWAKRFAWLLENHGQNPELYALFGRDAYMSSRPSEGKAAFNHAIKIAPQRRAALQMSAYGYRIMAFMRRCAKRVYIKMKL